MSEASELIANVIEKCSPELIEVRRDLHAHPELSWTEARTTEMIASRLEQAGLRVRRLPRSGLLAEVGDAGPCIALRGHLDSPPVADHNPGTNTGERGAGKEGVRTGKN